MLKKPALAGFFLRVTYLTSFAPKNTLESIFIEIKIPQAFGTNKLFPAKLFLKFNMRCINGKN